MDDIVPELLKTIQTQFEKKTYKSQKLKKALLRLDGQKATYADANDFAVGIGEILAEVLGVTIKTEVLPDGRMYFNIAERILNPTLQNNYDLVSEFTTEVQTALNESAGIGLKAQTPALNQDRIDNLIERVSGAVDFEEIKWMLQEPIINFTQSVVDDAIKANVDFHSDAGLNPTIKRTAVGKACDWCKNVAGTYKYGSEPKDIYKRHERCRCIVDYDPKDGG